MKRLFIGFVGFLSLLFGVTRAKAGSITFADQPAGASTFAYSPGPQTISEGNATFTGGVILTDETFADQNINVYATCSASTCGIDYNFANPITINFAQPVSNLTVVIVNNLADTFTLTDNNGNSVSANLPYLNNTGITLYDTGITTATIGTADPGWDFALEGQGTLTFTLDPADPAPTPEPPTYVLFGVALLGLGILAQRSARKGKI